MVTIFKYDTGQPNAGKFSSTGKLLKLWRYIRDLDLFVHILLQNLVKRVRSEVVAVWERVNFMPLEQLRILQAFHKIVVQFATFKVKHKKCGF